MDLANQSQKRDAWTNVSKIKGKNKTDTWRPRITEQSWDARMKAATEGKKPSPPSEAESGEGKAITFFFTNFPEWWS